SRSRALPPFPTRRSSDLGPREPKDELVAAAAATASMPPRKATLAKPQSFSISSSGDSSEDQPASLGTPKKETPIGTPPSGDNKRSEEHTSELQSRFDLVC